MRWEYPEPQRRFTSHFAVTLCFIGATFVLLLGFPILLVATTDHGINHFHRVWEVDLKQLGNFQFNDLKGNLKDIPQRFRDLNGKVVSIEGFMIFANGPSNDKVQDFELVYEIQPGIDGGPAMQPVQRRIFAHITTTALNYSSDEIRVIGTLHVAPNRDKDTGRIISIYTMDVNRVEPL